MIEGWRVDIPLREHSEDALPALPAENKWILVAFKKDREKVFAQSIATYQVPGNTLTCSSNKSTCDTGAASTVTNWFSWDN